MSVFATLHRTFLATLTACVRLCARRAWVTLSIATAFSGALLWYTTANLGINTDTEGMLDQDLPFRRAAREFDAAFPVLNDQIVIIVEAASGSAAAAASDALAQRLRRHPEVIQSVFHPGGDDFFATHGLLYLDLDDLWSMDERLAEAAPFLGVLAVDPGLRGLFKAMTTGLEEGDSGSHRLLTRMFNRISATIDAELAGTGQPVSWRDELFQAGGAKQDVVREFLLIKPNLDYASFEPAGRALELVHGEGRAVERDPGGVRVRVTGAAAMDSEELVTVTRDAKLTLSLAFVLVCVLLIWGLRSAGGVVAVLFSLLLGLIWTAAFATAAIGALNLISVTFAVLFIGMGVDFGIQYALRYHEECDRGLEKEAALCAAAAGAGGALTLAAAGAAISFLAFAPTSYRGLAELGVISAFSMLVALVTSFTLLPASLSLLPVPRRRITAPALPAQENGVLRRHRGPIIAVTTVIAVAGLLLAPKARFDFNPLNLKDPTTDAVAAYKDLAADPDSSPYTIQIVAPDPGTAETLADRLGQLPAVDKVLTLQSYVPADQATKLDIIDGMRLSLTGVLPAVDVAIPATMAEQVAALDGFSRALAATLAGAPEPAVAASMTRLQQALDKVRAAPRWPEAHLPVLERNLIGDLEDTLARLERALQAGPVTLQDLPEDLRARYVTADGRARIEVFPKHDLSDNRALSEFVHGVTAIAPNATDSPVILLAASDAVIGSCIQAATLALILTIIMHIIVLKSVLDAILVSVPLVLAMLLTVGTSVVFNFPFNFANIIALPLLIGLNNAYGVYLVVRRHSTPDLAQLLHSSTPRAVLLSGLASIASFGVLAIATHPGMGGMGILISLALGYALASSLVVLPAIMAALDARRVPAGSAVPKPVPVASATGSATGTSPSGRGADPRA